VFATVTLGSKTVGLSNGKNLTDVVHRMTSLHLKDAANSD
jgi:hypothetical protein